MIYHNIATRLSGAALLVIEDDLIQIDDRGWWPSQSGLVDVWPRHDIALIEQDRFIYLKSNGYLVISNRMIPYGSADAQVCDLLAWKTDDWNVKRLVNA
jgi:hypothetical protein